MDKAGVRARTRAVTSSIGRSNLQGSSVPFSCGNPGGLTAWEPPCQSCQTNNKQRVPVKNATKPVTHRHHITQKEIASPNAKASAYQGNVEVVGPPATENTSSRTISSCSPSHRQSIISLQMTLLRKLGTRTETSGQTVLGRYINR